ncbi:MAG: preprotein translocase subunit SecE [Bacilli bacterium]
MTVVKKSSKASATMSEVTSNKKEKEIKTSKVEDKANSKKKPAKKAKAGIFTRISMFFKETIKEVSKVKWPSRKDMVKYSVATIVFVLFFAVFFYLIDIIVALVKTWV